MTAHRVLRVVFDFGAPSRERAEELHRRLSAFAGARLGPTLCGCLDRAAGPGGSLVLDQLDVDLGILPLHEVEAALEERLGPALDAALRAATAAAGPGGGPTRHANSAPRAARDRALTALLRYLLAGQADATAGAAGAVPAALIDAALREGAESTLRLLRALWPLPSVRRRLTWQARGEGLKAVLAAALGDAALGDAALGDAELGTGALGAAARVPSGGSAAAAVGSVPASHVAPTVGDVARFAALDLALSAPARGERSAAADRQGADEAPPVPVVDPGPGDARVLATLVELFDAPGVPPPQTALAQTAPARPDAMAPAAGMRLAEAARAVLAAPQVRDRLAIRLLETFPGPVLRDWLAGAGPGAGRVVVGTVQAAGRVGGAFETEVWRASLRLALDPAPSAGGARAWLWRIASQVALRRGEDVAAVLARLRAAAVGQAHEPRHSVPAQTVRPAGGAVADGAAATETPAGRALPRSGVGGNGAAAASDDGTPARPENLASLARRLGIPVAALARLSAEGDGADIGGPAGPRAGPPAGRLDDMLAPYVRPSEPAPPWIGATGFDPGEEATAAGLSVENAGLVLLSPFLPGLFDRLELLADGAFRDPPAMRRAVHLTQYLVTGGSAAPEPVLSLNKLLCGMALEAPIEAGITLARDEKATAESLFDGVRQNWPAVKNTSAEGLRETFLQRRGVLRLGAGQPTLHVEKGPYDMLLGQIPWPLSPLRLSWMPEALFVKWT